MQEVLVNCLGSLSLPRKSVARLTDRLDMTLDVFRGRKTTTQQQQRQRSASFAPLIQKIYCYLSTLASALSELQWLEQSLELLPVLSFCLKQLLQGTRSLSLFLLVSVI